MWVHVGTPGMINKGTRSDKKKEYNTSKGQERSERLYESQKNVSQERVQQWFQTL